MIDNPNNKDSDVTNDEAGSEISFSPGGIDIIRFDPTKDIPVISSGPISALEGYKKYQEEGDWAELTNISAAAADLGINVVTYLADPLNFLIGAGLGFLIDVIQPLEDALGLVTGNPERMEAEVSKWERVEKALGPLAEEIRSAANEGLISWEGKAAEAAKTRFNLFADGVEAAGEEVKQVVSILNIAKTVMDIAQAFVISLMATFVEWLVWTWVPALAAAGPTFGASTAAAGAATTAQAGIVTSRLSAFITKVVLILRRLRRVLFRMHLRRMHRVKTTFQMREGGNFAKGWIGSRQALINSLKDYRTYLGTVQKSANTAINESKSYYEYMSSNKDDKIDDKLDPTR
jgi:hypothetical protein